MNNIKFAEGLYKIEGKRLYGHFNYINEDGTIEIEHDGYNKNYNADQLVKIEKEELYDLLIENETYLYNSYIEGGHEETLKEWYYGQSRHNVHELPLPELNEYLKPFNETYSTMSYEQLMDKHFNMCTGLYEE